MINILVLLEAIDFQPCEDDENKLHKYLNYELNGIEYEDSFRIPKHFRNLLRNIKSIL
jgi:hypothetical protein